MSEQDGQKPPEETAGQPPEGGLDEEAKAAAEKAAKAEAAKKAAEAAARAKAEREAAEAAKPAWERDPATPEWSEAGDDPLAAALSAAHGDAVESARRFAGDLVLEIRPGAIREVAATLREEHGYLLLVDVCGSHYPQRGEHPLEVVYHVYNLEMDRRARLKVKLAEGAEVPSVTPVWRGANWLEREVYDMFGIRFEGHPDMTRILLWEGFEGHPLRKEFPVEGVDTGAAIYPEYYEEEAGPVAGTGTGWKPAAPAAEPSGDDAAGGES